MQQLGKCHILPLGRAIDGLRCCWLPAALKTHKRRYTSGQSELHTESWAVRVSCNSGREGCSSNLGECTFVSRLRFGFGDQVVWRQNSRSWLTISRLTLLQIFVITRTFSWCYQEVIRILDRKQRRGGMLLVRSMHASSERIKGEPQWRSLAPGTHKLMQALETNSIRWSVTKSFIRFIVQYVVVAHLLEIQKWVCFMWHPCAFYRSIEGRRHHAARLHYVSTDIRHWKNTTLR